MTETQPDDLMIAAPGPVSGPEPGVTHAAMAASRPRARVEPGLAQTCYFLTNGPGVTLSRIARVTFPPAPGPC